MSNIPLAREHLRDALKHGEDAAYMRVGIRMALSEMTRRRPTFRVDDELPTLTRAERRKARALRTRGWSLNSIATVLHTNIGRVSEAVNGKSK